MQQTYMNISGIVFFSDPSKLVIESMIFWGIQ